MILKMGRIAAGPLHLRFAKNLPEDLRVDVCWPWQGYVRPDGYSQFHLTVAEKRKLHAAGTITGHRASWIVHFGVSPVLLVCHKCFLRSCVNPAHLFLGSYHQNMQDGVNKSLVQPAFLVKKLEPEDYHQFLRPEGRTL
jgi:hypothetical protein